MNPPGIASRIFPTAEEWNLRNAVLSERMAELIGANLPAGASAGVEVGCQQGALTDAMARLTPVPEWVGVDPVLTAEDRSPGGHRLLPGRANALGFPDASFDVVLFANVYEHVPPPERTSSLAEMFRVLRPGGLIVGQLPNPWFPIESHSRLPFLGWLPIGLQRRYWRLSPARWDHDFFRVTVRHLTRTARAAGFEIVLVRRFNYPPEVIPGVLRRAAQMLERPMRRMPWAWQFVLRRPA